MSDTLDSFKRLPCTHPMQSLATTILWHCFSPLPGGLEDQGGHAMSHIETGLQPEWPWASERISPEQGKSVGRKFQRYIHGPHFPDLIALPFVCIEDSGSLPTITYFVPKRHSSDQDRGNNPIPELLSALTLLKVQCPWGSIYCSLGMSDGQDLRDGPPSS